MNIVVVTIVGFVSGLAIDWLVLKIFLSDLRPASTGRMLAILGGVAVALVVGLLMMDTFLEFLSDSSETRDVLGRVFLGALTVGIGGSTFFRRFRNANKGDATIKSDRWSE